MSILYKLKYTDDTYSNGDPLKSLAQHPGRKMIQQYIHKLMVQVLLHLEGELT